MQERTSIRKKAKIKISHRAFFLTAMFYLIAPVFIFFLSWIRLYIAVPACLLLMLAIFYFYKDLEKDNTNSLTKDNYFEVSSVHIIILVAASVILAYSFGIGEYIWATRDHAFRRAIFRDLISHKWPVFFDLTKMENPEVNALFPDKVVAFGYYFAFWIIPALIGKLLGFGVGNIALLLWSALGIFLTILGINMICKRETYFSIFAFVFFSGLDIIPNQYFNIFGTAEPWMWLEGYTKHISYISNINNLLNVYNQVIPCYLIVVLLLLQKNTRSEGLIAASCFAYSPWATIGMLPIAIYSLFAKKMRDADGKVVLKNIFTIGNIIPAIVILLCYAPMYMANAGVASIKGNTMSFYGSFGQFLFGYALVFVIELLPSIILFGRRHLYDGLFWTVLISLMLMPLYKVSKYNDFTMRGGMPLLFVFTIMLAELLTIFFEEYKNKEIKDLNLLFKILGKFLIVFTMSCVALQMYLGIISLTIKGGYDSEDVYSLENITSVEYAIDSNSNYYVYDYEDTLFYSKIAKQNPNK